MATLDLTQQLMLTLLTLTLSGVIFESNKKSTTTSRTYKGRNHISMHFHVDGCKKVLSWRQSAQSSRHKLFVFLKKKNWKKNPNQKRPTSDKLRKKDRLLKQRKEKNMPFLSWLVDASIFSQSIFRLFGGKEWSMEGAKNKHQRRRHPTRAISSSLSFI